MRIKSLIVENFALITYAEISFPVTGLVVLTGETGAGKTMVFDALAFVTGGRAHSTLIKHLATECKVTCALIDDSGKHQVITRSYSRSGENKCTLNGIKLKVAEVNALFANAFELTGQNDATGLFKPSNHLLLLDAFRNAGALKDTLFDDYSGVHKEINLLERKLHILEQSELHRQRELDFCTFEIGELNSNLPDSSEILELEQEFKLLENAQSIIIELQQVNANLNGHQGEYQGALDLLGSATTSLRRCNELLGLESALAEPYNNLETALNLMQDSVFEISNFFDNIQPDNQRLASLETLFNELNRIAKKHDCSIEQLYSVKQQLAEKLQVLTSSDQDPQKLREEINQLVIQRKIHADKLTETRFLTIANMEKQIKDRLANLNCNQVEFVIDLHAIGDQDTPVYSNTGQDECEFLISLNPGEPVRSLSRVASGGETSRIFLAMKSALAGITGLETMLFDEIDAGVGGETSQAVANELAKMGANALVVCVSHLPVVAAKANNHWLVDKTVVNRLTIVQLINLQAKARVLEIARMLGDRSSETNLKRASELIELNKI